MNDAQSSGRGTGWWEAYLDGTPSAEAALIAKFASEIRHVQTNIQAREHAAVVRRAFHAKLQLGVSNAAFNVLPRVPRDLQVGLFEPGRSYPATIRISNASGAMQKDSKRDLRGVAIRVQVGPGQTQDFLMTNGAASHARDARQFMVAASALASQSKLLILPRLILGLGPLETVRMLLVMLRQARTITSLATERYWSRGPFAFGPIAVKYLLRPQESSPRHGHPDGDNYLRDDLIARLKRGPIVFDFQVQRYVDETRTPIEDATVEWSEADTPPETIAQLFIPQQDLTTSDARAVAAQIDALAFNPWNTTEGIRPLGSLNRARKLVYASGASFRGADTSQIDAGGSAARLQRSGIAYRSKPGSTAFWRVYEGIWRLVNRFATWDKLPLWLGIANLIAVRNELVRENLSDTATHALPPVPTIRAYEARFLRQRQSDGIYNDLAQPEMGSSGYRFGRNVPLANAFPETGSRLLHPSPREISRHLLKRDEFVPAESLNLLAAAWIQFQTHDWFAHQVPQPGNEFEIPLAQDDDWHQGPMRVRRTPADTTRTPADAALPPTYRNRGSHWWDASQIYGSDPTTTNALRSLKDGKLLIDEGTHFLPLNPETGMPITGFSDNWWVGLNLLHTLFAREHNAICDELRSHNPYWTDQQVFETARLVNSALMTKIHSIDWTPAITAHPTIVRAQNIDWWGIPGQAIRRTFGRLSQSSLISGIPGMKTDLEGAPFSLTEEFVAVYRLHPLLPEDIAFHSATSGARIKRLSMPDVSFEKAQTVFDDETSMLDVLYSFGISNPGAVTLHNYPEFLRNLTLPNGQHLDLAAIDIMRDRERGVPRYNAFRELFHRGPVRSFDEITPNPTWARELREMYEGDVNRVDLMVGMYAEQPPKGFGFSDTAFRVFVLMAPRRIKSDRFLTTDLSPEVYSPAGLAWLEASTMTTVLLRHYPELAPALRHVKNPFAPWRRIDRL